MQSHVHGRVYLHITLDQDLDQHLLYSSFSKSIRGTFDSIPSPLLVPSPGVLLTASARPVTIWWVVVTSRQFRLCDKFSLPLLECLISMAILVTTGYSCLAALMMALGLATMVVLIVTKVIARWLITRSRKTTIVPTVACLGIPITIGWERRVLEIILRPFCRGRIVGWIT